MTHLFHTFAGKLKVLLWGLPRLLDEGVYQHHDRTIRGEQHAGDADGKTDADFL